MKIEHSKDHIGRHIFAVLDGDRVAGTLTVTERRSFVQVGQLDVMYSYRRKGVATKLYTHAAKFACRKFGKPLASDDVRSVGSQGFWRKQLKKGRATCVDTSGAYGYDPESGRSTRRKIHKCAVFALSCPAPPSLKGRHAPHRLRKM